ncbi:MAG: hypothetical protein U0992_15760 [Planctomycetaceae bacterium]
MPLTVVRPVVTSVLFCGWKGIEAPGSMLSQIALTGVRSSEKPVILKLPADEFVMLKG